MLIQHRITTFNIVKTTTTALLFHITAIAAFPPIAEALSKNCGQTFTLKGDPLWRNPADQVAIW